MIYSQLTISIILIICGFLVEKHPELIAGYNTLPKAKKEKIKIEVLSKFLKHLLIALGILVLLVYFVLSALQIEETLIVKTNDFLIVFIVIVALIFANTNKRFKN